MVEGGEEPIAMEPLLMYKLLLGLDGKLCRGQPTPQMFNVLSETTVEGHPSKEGSISCEEHPRILLKGGV